MLIDPDGIPAIGVWRVIIHRSQIRYPQAVELAGRLERGGCGESWGGDERQILSLSHSSS